MFFEWYLIIEIYGRVCAKRVKILLVSVWAIVMSAGLGNNALLLVIFALVNGLMGYQSEDLIWCCFG